jgi:glycerate kinase
MHILVAPNAFKGSLPAKRAAEAVAAGIRSSPLRCSLTLFPVADGGDGTVPLLTEGMGGVFIPVRVHDPAGRALQARFGWVATEVTALVAVSDASGLHLLEKAARDPLHVDTRGTGELIGSALGRGARRLVVGVGGSATVDGGSGLLRALGVRFLDDRGADIADLPAGLRNLERIDLSGLDMRLKGKEIIVLCDVNNRLLGPGGAAAVYGPQKGAGEREVAMLEACMERLSVVAEETTGKRMDSLVAGGAAGGVAAALAVFCGARLVSGIDYFLDALHFEALLQAADIVITGEGSLDAQTAEGKAPFGVALRARQAGCRVVGMAGCVDDAQVLRPYFDELIAVNPPGMSVQEAMALTAESLRRSAFEWAARQAGGEA